MGGNALKTVTLVRLDKKGYDKISKKIQAVLTKFGIISARTLSYENKPDFGDLDLLIKSSTLPNVNMRTFIEENFSPNEIYHNGSAWSFDYKKFQIDFILVNDDNWETSNVYFSYNDLGNFMGRISYQMGFRYGDYGLKLNYYYESKKFEKIISKEPEKIFEFLGYNWNRYKKGFRSLEDIFNFVTESRYFSKEIFDYDSLNHQNRTRNKKRKNYQLFLEHVSEKENNISEFKSQDEYIDEAEKFFGLDIWGEINKWKEDIEYDKKVKEKFNGLKIINEYGLKGESIGIAIKTFKEYVTERNYNGKWDVRDDITKNFNEWVLNTSVDEVWETFEKANNINLN